MKILHIGLILSLGYLSLVTYSSYYLSKRTQGQSDQSAWELATSKIKSDYPALDGSSEEQKNVTTSFNDHTALLSVLSTSEIKSDHPALDGSSEEQKNVTTSIHPPSKKKYNVREIRRNFGNFEEGGIVIFFHMPKTGGTSIREAAKRSLDIELVTNKKKSMARLRKEILSWTLSKDKTVGKGKQVKMVELHWDLDSLVEMKVDLDIWRKNSKENDIPFFVFTVLAEPAYTYMSFYNFFCIRQTKLRTLDCDGPHTADHVMKVSPDNPQARWLCKATTLGLQKKTDDAKTRIDLNKMSLPDPLDQDPYCSNIIEIVKETFDWVALKSRSKKTIKLLSVMGIHLENRRTNKNKMPDNLKFYEFSTEKQEMMRKNLKIDQELYDWAESTFTF